MRPAPFPLSHLPTFPFALASALLIVAAAAGCSHVRVTVDCTAARDDLLLAHLDGPRYVLHAPSDDMEASLLFTEFADLWQRALTLHEPELQRVPDDDHAVFQMTLAFGVFDRGTGLAGYPVHVHAYGGYGYPWHRYDGFYPGYRYAGTRVEPVHLGYLHDLFVTAWLPDEAAPAHRRVLWEGRAQLNARNLSLKPSMPYLMAALAPYFGRPTEGPETLKFDGDDDDRVEEVAG